jgi:hypothetical protein
MKLPLVMNELPMWFGHTDRGLLLADGLLLA